MRKKRADSQKSVIDMNEAPKGLPSLTWAMLIKKVYGVDPLICTRCGGNMRIVGFVTTELEIRETLLELGMDIPSVRAPRSKLATESAEMTLSDLRRKRYFDDRLEVSLRDMPVSLGKSGHAGLVWGICGLRPYLHSRERNNPGVKTEKTMNLTGTKY